MHGLFDYLLGFAAGSFSGWWVWGRALRDLVKAIKAQQEKQE